MPGAGLTSRRPGQAGSDRLILKPYWGKPAVRNFRGGGGNVGIIRSPVRATALPDATRWLARSPVGLPTHQHRCAGHPLGSADLARRTQRSGPQGIRNRKEIPVGVIR